MNVEPAYLYAALLDVLAYREHLEEDRRSGTLAFQAKLATALKVFDSVNEAVFRVQAISDTIILTCSAHAEFPRFLSLLRDVFLAFLDEHLFVRGGVAYSRHFQSKHLTYSHAVAKAYEIESRVATYPRIVIDENIIRMYEVGDDLPSLTSSGLLCLQNGAYFLDVLTAGNWTRAWTAANEIYNENPQTFRSSEAAFIKHIMFERYLLTSPHALAGSTPYTQQITRA